MGTTCIDIEDRWFTKEWKRLRNKPVERRTLKSPYSSYSQGKLEMWCDIFDETQIKLHPPIPIKPPPPEEFEVRVIISASRLAPKYFVIQAFCADLEL